MSPAAANFSLDTINSLMLQIAAYCRERLDKLNHAKQLRQAKLKEKEEKNKELEAKSKQKEAVGVQAIKKKEREEKEKAVLR